MISDVDDALVALIKRDALNGTDVDVLFDAPTKDWAARRNSPTLDLYLYDIREEAKLRAYGTVDVKGDNGLTSGRKSPPRYFKLSYLVTAWTQRPEDEHRLLSATLLCLLRNRVLPGDLVGGVVADQGLPVQLLVAQPPPDERSISEVWTALGGELKPSLDIACIVPVDVRGLTAVGPPVLEQARIRMADEEAGGGRRRSAGETGDDRRGVEEEVVGGTEPEFGRRFTFRTVAGDRDR